MFSDECEIEIHGYRVVYVRRPSGLGERFKVKYTQATVKQHHKSIMVFGAIWASGLRKLVRVDGTLNSERYIRIMGSEVIPLLGENDIFKQDAASAHKSRKTMQFLEETGVSLLVDWPAQSPDLNIIENVSAEVKRLVAEKSPRNELDLWNVTEMVFSAFQMLLWKSYMLPFRKECRLWHGQKDAPLGIKNDSLFFYYRPFLIHD